MPNQNNNCAYCTFFYSFINKMYAAEITIPKKINGFSFTFLKIVLTSFVIIVIHEIALTKCLHKQIKFAEHI